jgi:hypothetical protein
MNSLVSDSELCGHHFPTGGVWPFGVNLPISVLAKPKPEPDSESIGCKLLEVTRRSHSWPSSVARPKGGCVSGGQSKPPWGIVARREARMGGKIENITDPSFRRRLTW